MENLAQKVEAALRQSLNELDTSNLAVAVRDGTLAADLHAFYNVAGLKEGWLQKEYATPLSRQDATNQAKNVLAAADVAKYWISQVGTAGVVDLMKAAVDYKSNRGIISLEAAADAQHEQWRKFMEQYQKERITPGHPKFREKNFKQYQSSYAQLSEQEKDQDRLVVAVVTDRILAKAGIGYEVKIKF